MKFVLGVTTYCRLSYLRQMLESWLSTRNKKHSWAVVVADDGSPEIQISEIHFLLNNTEHYVIENQRRGIHHQINQILKFCDNLEFDFGFRADDDIVFKQSGWDDAYYHAATTTGYWHLVHHDPHWKRVKRHKQVVYHNSGLLENQCYWNDLQGAFWTFNKQVISSVGYFDIRNFGLCGFGHRDYTYRCCKCGYNFFDPNQNGYEQFDCIWDLKNSASYIELHKDDYVSAPDRDEFWNKWNSPDCVAKKLDCFLDSRKHVDYNEVRPLML